VETIAHQWDVSPATVRRWARDGYLPAIRVGTFWRFEVDALRRIVEKANAR